MKKLFILFILLLLSGGGLFAQVTNPSVSISGNAATASASDHTPGACAANTFAQSQSTAWSFTCAALTLAGAQFANQGTTTTVAHGNAAGNPSWGSVVDGDIAFTTPSLGAPTITNGWIVSTSPAVTHIDQSTGGVFDFYRTDSITDSVAFRLWNGRVDASNYQRLFLGSDGSGFQIGTYNAGSGAAQSLRLATSGVLAVSIDTSQNTTFSGQVIPSQTIGIVGTTTNNNANAGAFGEYQTGTVAANTTSLSTGSTANVGANTNITLTAGDWDCWGVVNFTFGATTSITNITGGISTTSATLPAQDSYFDYETAASIPTATAVAAWVVPTVRLSLSGSTNVFLVSQATFTASTLKVGGTIRCRRMR